MKELTWQDAERVLARNHFGRLACYSPSHDASYITPMSYTFHNGSIYLGMLPGQKLDFLREHPQGVCFEVDEIYRTDTWFSVIGTGIFVELKGRERHEEIAAAMDRALHGPLRARFYAKNGHSGLAPEALHLCAIRITNLTAREDTWTWEFDFPKSLEPKSLEKVAT